MSRVRYSKKMIEKANKRERVLELLKAGQLTQSEAGVLLGISRQRVHQWVKSAKIHPESARTRHLRKLLNADTEGMHA